MRGPYTQLYVHCVWATWDRLPLLTAAYELQIHASIAAKCHELGCTPVAIGGIEDHVHLLTQVPAKLSIADLVKEVKGSSSHLMTHVLQPGVFFKWQGAYGAFTVSKEGVTAVAEYIENQKAHHAANKLLPDWERCEEIYAG
jgi:putative transposase